MTTIAGAADPGDALALTRRAAAGDERALRSIMQPLAKRLSSMAWHMTYDHHEAQDLCQEALLKITSPGVLLRYRGDGPLEGFLLRSAVRAMISVRRTRAVAHQRATIVTDALPEVAFHDQADALGLDGALREAMLKLPERARIIVLLIAVGGYTNEEVADAVELPVGTVKSAYSRARATLRAALAEQPA